MSDEFSSMIGRYSIRVLIAAFLIVVGSTTQTLSADSPEDASLYHRDPEHLWNRLHNSIFVRIGRDEKTYGFDRLEPLLWGESQHLLVEPSHQRVMSVLDEFIATNGETLINDPTKRAVLQRDLWLVWNGLSNASQKLPKDEAAKLMAARNRLQKPLAAIIDRLALSPQQIRDLPDHYSAAVASGSFAKQFDPERSHEPFLPSDLFNANGPWVCVGRTDIRTAPQHLREENPYTNSVFLVFIRIPAGRSAVADYLKQRPRLPRGTQLALVRRALLIDSSHQIVMSNLTESVQLRILMEPENFSERQLSRVRLFAGQSGGLRPLETEDRDFKTGFSAKLFDPFEQFADRPLERLMHQPLKSCVNCHNERFNEFQSNESFNPGKTATPFPLVEQEISNVAKAAIEWRKAQSNWKSLEESLRLAKSR